MRLQLTLHLFCYSIIFSSVSAQEVTETRALSLDDVLLRAPSLLPRQLPGLSWCSDSRHYSYLKKTEDGIQWIRSDVDSGREVVIGRQGGFGAAAKKAGFDGLGLAAMAQAKWRAENRARVEFRGQVIEVDLAPLSFRSVAKTPADAQARAFSPDDGHSAWVKDWNVRVAKPDGSTVEVTRGGFESLTYGLAVSRVEFGITDGLWWSPDGRRLAFYREDLRPIEAYPYIDFKARPAKHRLGRYPMAGRKASIVTIGVYDTRDDSVIWLATDPAKDEFLTNVTWGPESKRLYVAHVNRDQNEMEMHRYSAADGRPLGRLFREADEQWIEPEHGPIFLPDASGDFLWFSPRDGFHHLYLHRADGHLMQQVTRGPWDVSEFAGFDSEGKSIFFTTTGPDPRQRHLYRSQLSPPRFTAEFPNDRSVDLKRADDGGKPVTTGRGQHQTLISPDHRHVLDLHSNLETTPTVDLLRADGKRVRRVYESTDPAAKRLRGKAEFFQAKSKDGDTLHGHVIYPPDFDASRRYPTIVWVYSGPHSQYVRDEWMGGLGGMNLWLHYMASQGFICMRLDGRGTANRGIEWSQSVHRRLGTLEIDDQVAGLDHLIAKGGVDPNRVGVFGWSYGGYMTLSLMTRAGDRFRAGVAGAPVTDWRYYETGYGERYMDRPEENKKGYDESDPGRHAKGLEGRLLVVHGSSDVTVVWQHTLDFLSKCIDEGKDVDYMVYPGQLHGLRGKSREHFYRKMTRFFERELSAEPVE